MEMGARPVGHQAQEAARVEACVPAFAPDLSPGLSPAEADLDVLLDVPGGVEGRILAGLLVEGDGVPELDSPVYAGDQSVGTVRSAIFSPSLQSVVVLAVLDSRSAIPGESVRIGDTNATVVAKPFLRRRTAQ